MDVIMSSLWSTGRQLNNDTFMRSANSTINDNSSTNTYLIHQMNFEPPQQQVRISPTITVIDAHFPTAAVAEVPMRSSMASVADFPPPSASLTSRTNLTSQSANESMPNILNSSPTPPALDLASSTTNVEKKNSLTEASSAFRPLLNNNPNNTSFNDFLAIALNTLIPMSSPSVASSNCDGPNIDFSAESADSTSFNDSASATSSSASYAFADGKGTLLCQVCSDRASGFHYGINSCEGCKGFFRRSIQQKIQYKACTKNQQCAIVRVNRNRCQDCRFQKCLAVGMSRDAVRFGRVPKREKVKMAEEMQRASLRSQIDLLSVELEDESAIIHSIELGFVELGAQLRRLLNGFNHHKEAENFEQNEPLYFSLISAVVNFSKSIKGFNFLHKKDCMSLLKNSIFQILLIRWTSLKNDPKMETNEYCGFQRELLLEPKLILKYLLIMNENKNPNFSTLIIEFVQRFRLLGLDERQLSIFSALILCQPADSAAGVIGTSTHLHQAALLKNLKEKLWICLQTVLFPPQLPRNGINTSLLNQSIFASFADLKALSAMHHEQLLVTQWRNKNEQNETVSNNNLPQNDNNLLATLAAVAASREFLNNENSNTITSANNNHKDRKRSILEQSLETKEESRRITEMPTLRRTLEQPSRINAVQRQNVATTMNNNLQQGQHYELAALLQQQPLFYNRSNIAATTSCNNNTTNTTTSQLLASFHNALNQQQQFKDKALKKWDYFGNTTNIYETVSDDDEPLNLCIRKI